ncbi:flagellar brake protein [Alicyclobacillus fastidiosus]|uniref:flagellar brake protein n=1 Tax=Alicyclobacillus fastidiosus TaxID=392011 RepID=UPI0023E93902|nr:flagellar brake domain-containing protein [Alicyclobacillus fastidiosus]GMA64623.1 hypothetical protein GCM10025859_50630 [Alicyclobacillus fastidiosus]
MVRLYPMKLQDAMVTIVGSEPEEEHKVRIVDITEDTVVITPPFDQNGYAMFLPEGTRIVVGYVQTAYFEFETRVLHNVRSRIPLVIVQKPELSQISKEQRRQSFRVPVTITAKITIDGGTSFVMNLLDLSAGGLLAVSSTKRLTRGISSQARSFSKRTRGRPLSPFAERLRARPSRMASTSTASSLRTSVRTRTCSYATV